MSPLSSDKQWASKEAALPFSGMELAAISLLLDRDWFKRLWIWQEVKLVFEVIFLCGTNNLSWTVIRDPVFSIYVKTRAQYYEIEWSDWRLLHSLCKGPKVLTSKFG